MTIYQYNKQCFDSNKCGISTNLNNFLDCIPEYHNAAIFQDIIWGGRGEFAFDKIL